jgi:putative flippase GtrA
MSEESTLKEISKPTFKKSFLRSQIVSLTATTADFSFAMMLNYFLGVYYVTATSLGSFFGAIISFSLGRNWVFLNRQGKLRKQVFRFFVINLFSIFANTTGVFFFKENFNINFALSRVITAVFVGVFFNYFMNRYFVFK